MMSRKIVAGCFLFVFFVGLVCSFADDQFIDVVRLKDGTTLRGLVVDQKAGVSLKLATADRLVYTLENNEIDDVRKRRTTESIPFSYNDVIMLEDGVVFRGMIVEQQPEKSVVLQTDNDILLTFRTEEIWKILKEKQITGKPPEKQERQARAEREGVKLQFQIEITRTRIRKNENALQGGSAQASGDLQSEIDSLSEEVRDLESAEDQAEQQVLDERRSEEREKIEELHGDVESMIDELLEMLDQCEGSTQSSASAEKPMQIETVGIQPIAPRSLELRSLGGFANDFKQNPDLVSSTVEISSGTETNEQLAARMEASLDGLVQQTLQKLPTHEEIDKLAEVQQARVELIELLKNGQWRRVAYKPELEFYAAQLTIEDRLFLYDTHKRRDPVRGVVLNAIPFLYLGCWAQRDWIGALVGYGLFAGSLAAAGAMGQVQLWFYAPAYGYGLLEPFLFTYLRNSRMKRSLQVDARSARQESFERTAAIPAPVQIEPSGQNGFEVYVELVSLHY